MLTIPEKAFNHIIMKLTKQQQQQQQNSHSWMTEQNRNPSLPILSLGLQNSKHCREQSTPVSGCTVASIPCDPATYSTTVFRKTGMVNEMINSEV